MFVTGWLKSKMSVWWLASQMAPKKPHFLVFTPHVIPTSHIYQGGSVQPRVEGMVWNFQDQVVEDTTCFLLVHPLALSVSLSTLSRWGRQLSSHSRSLGNPGGKDLSEAFVQKPEKNQGLLLTAMWAWNRTLQPWDTFQWLRPLWQRVCNRVTEAGPEPSGWVAPTCPTKTVWDTEC